MENDEILKIANSLEALAVNPMSSLSIDDIRKTLEKKASESVDGNELDKFMNIILDSLEQF